MTARTRAGRGRVLSRVLGHPGGQNLDLGQNGKREREENGGRVGEVRPGSVLGEGFMFGMCASIGHIQDDEEEIRERRTRRSARSDPPRRDRTHPFGRGSSHHAEVT